VRVAVLNRASRAFARERARHASTVCKPSAADSCLPRR
jgi:hypothetical protein